MPECAGEGDVPAADRRAARAQDLTGERGQPRVDYERTYLLLLPGKPKAWAWAAIPATWNQARLTVGASADDAGIGNLSYRRVIAVNPNEWPGNLKVFFDPTFPGIEYVPVTAASPADLSVKLTQVPGPAYPPPPRGQPGIGCQYDRTYVLLPPPADAAWAQAVIEATWEARQCTLGGSADDAYWNAEMCIPSGALGGWNHLVRLNVFHEWALRIAGRMPPPTTGRTRGRSRC